MQSQISVAERMIILSEGAGMRNESPATQTHVPDFIRARAGANLCFNGWRGVSSLLAICHGLVMLIFMIPVIQNSFVSGELSPSFLGRTDKPQYRNGASTMRNMFVRYQGGAYSRAGFAFVGMCKQGAPNAGTAGSINVPPRDINFQVSINQGFALEFGNLYLRIKSAGAYVTESAQNVTYHIGQSWCYYNPYTWL